MNNALEVAEIRQEIYKWFQMPVAWRPQLNSQPGTPLRDDRGTIVNLACTRRDFYEELMPMLWRTLHDFRHLLHLIPHYHEPLPQKPDDQRQSGTFDTDLLSTDDVSCYVHYAKYVEELGWDIELGQPFKGLEEYQILLEAIPASHPRFLLPSLQSLHMYNKGSIEVLALLSFFAPFSSLICLNHMGYDKMKNLIGLYGYSHFNDVPLTPFKLTKLCLREIRTQFSEEIVFLVRNSPSLTHLILPNTILREWLADVVIESGLQLVAMHFYRFEPIALSKLLDFVAPSLQWLKITERAPTHGEEVILKMEEFPALRELYFMEYRPIPFQLGNILKPTLPSLHTLGINISKLPPDKNPTPGTLTVLQNVSVQHPFLFAQVTSLLLTMYSWLLRYEEGTSWGNVVLSLFPNLENLSIKGHGNPTKITEEQPLIHPNLRHLRLCDPSENGDYESLLKGGGSLRTQVPKLETIAFHKSWNSEKWVCRLAERQDLEVKVLLWEDESVNHFEVLTAGIDV